MIVAPAAAEIASFRDVVAERLGLYFEDGKLDFLADVLRLRMEDTGCRRFPLYRDRICFSAEKDEETCALAQRLTVGETYFFRYAEHFRALAEAVLPDCIQARRQDHRLRILSAGCASGEEPYSVAILFRERFPELASWKVEILGFDVNSAILEKALRARYSPWSLRETPDELRLKYFHADGRDFRLDSSVRSDVCLEERNLIKEDPAFWVSETFDVVLCRNVTMYFTPEVTRAVIRRVARSLRPGGFLFLGHAETLRAVSQEFHLCHTHETFYYQRREAGETESLPVLKKAGQNVNPRPGLLDVSVESEESWFSTIRRASERIADLTQKKRPSASAFDRATFPKRQPQFAQESACDRAPAIELLRGERFSEAMDLLRALPQQARDDVDTQLLMAVLLVNKGEVAEAERACRQVLGLDELNASAHYLMALCREQSGNPEAAIQHDEVASYLDSTFSMPHLHLGLVAKRLGEMEMARRELGQALSLFDREDASRILLFGGGFTREALITFCRVQLEACGGAA